MVVQHTPSQDGNQTIRKLCPDIILCITTSATEFTFSVLCARTGVDDMSENEMFMIVSYAN